MGFPEMAGLEMTDGGEEVLVRVVNGSMVWRLERKSTEACTIVCRGQRGEMHGVHVVNMQLTRILAP